MRTTEGGNGSLRPHSSTRHLPDGGAASRKLTAAMSISMGRSGACARRKAQPGFRFKDKHACNARSWCFSGIVFFFQNMKGYFFCLYRNMVEKWFDLELSKAVFRLGQNKIVNLPLVSCEFPFFKVLF